MAEGGEGVKVQGTAAAGQQHGTIHPGRLSRDAGVLVLFKNLRQSQDSSFRQSQEVHLCSILRCASQLQKSAS